MANDNATELRDIWNRLMPLYWDCHRFRKNDWGTIEGRMMPKPKIYQSAWFKLGTREDSLKVRYSIVTLSTPTVKKLTQGIMLAQQTLKGRLDACAKAFRESLGVSD